MDRTRVPELMAWSYQPLEDKLVREQVARDPEEARALFAEVKKYLALTRLDLSRDIPMFSRRIDEVWHHFVLYTEAYTGFSKTFFGEYAHHSPFTAPESAAERAPLIDFADFETEYGELFGALSPLWHDDRGVDDDTRIIRATFGKPIEVVTHGETTELVWRRDPPQILLRTSARAAAALQFLIDNDHLYVRELPGLPAADRIAIARSLVKSRVLRVAP